MRYVLILASLVFVGCSAAKKSETQATEAPKAAASTNKEIPKKEETKAVSASTGDKVTCSYGEIKREIQIIKRDGQCVVEYTKDGSTNEIATGLSTSNFCKEVQERIKNNLVGAGYTCQ